MKPTRLSFHYTVICNNCHGIQTFTHSIEWEDADLKGRDFSYECGRCGFYNIFHGEIGMNR